MKLERKHTERNSKLRLQMSTYSWAGTDVFGGKRKGEGKVEATRK